jgi:hypothetical protein
MLIILLLLCLPVTGISVYAYYTAGNTDFGINQAADSVTYHIYQSYDTPGGRVIASKFNPNDELAGFFDAVKVVYDVPLPAIIQTGKNSAIVVKQVLVRTDFNLEKFVNSVPRDPQSDISPAIVNVSANGKGYVLSYGALTYVYVLTQDNVLIEISSQTVRADELIQFANSLK